MRTGRLLRQQMRDDAQETPERIALRIAHRKACEQANRECQEKFPELTPDNFREAIEWQEQRIRELSPEWREVKR